MTFPDSSDHDDDKLHVASELRQHLHTHHIGLIQAHLISLRNLGVLIDRKAGKTS